MNFFYFIFLFLLLFLSVSFLPLTCSIRNLLLTDPTRQYVQANYPNDVNMSKLITPQECFVCAGAPDSVQCLICLLTSLLKSFPRSLLKSGVGPLARYGKHQKIINRGLKQIYTSSDTRLGWPGEGPLFELDSDKCWEAKTRPLFESPTRPLLK